MTNSLRFSISFIYIFPNGNKVLKRVKKKARSIFFYIIKLGIVLFGLFSVILDLLFIRQGHLKPV
jgi:hypothetical protein